MNNVLVVSNLSAGRKRAIKYRRKIQTLLLKKHTRFQFITIDELQDVDMENFDTILVVGGDGTVNKLLPYLVNTNKILGIIPTGTANLLAANLGINSASKALEVVDRENSTKIDVMTINNKLSVLRCGLGYDADIIGKTPQSLKNKFGYFAYFIAGIIFALRLKKKEYSVIIDNKERTIKASCIIVANAGNMYQNLFSIAKNSKLDDGLFDIFILKIQNPILFFIEFLRILLNIKSSSKIAEYIKAKDFKIKNNYCLAHIDGEKIKFMKDLDFTNRSYSINIYCKEDICLEKIETLTEDWQKTMV